MSGAARLLELLDHDALTELADAVGLDPPSGLEEGPLRSVIAAYEPATLHTILAALPRETLKSVCKALGLKTDGRGRHTFVRQLVEHLGRATDEGARSLQVEVFPKRPRLAWNGMDQREAVTSVPTQVVEIVRPGRAVDRSEGIAPELPSLDARTVTARGDDLPPNRLIWTNDNLVALRTLLDERDPQTREHRYRGKVDLVYIDPPFMVGSDFRGDNTVSIDIDEEAGITAQKEPSLVEFIAYRDTWRNGLDSFLAMLRRRLELLKELLAPTGSIYVHLDWHAVHYVKVLMDEIFGYENFRNEIVWQRTSSHNDPGKYGIINDSILFYAMSDAMYWGDPKRPPPPHYFDAHDIQTDESGRMFRSRDLTAPNLRFGETGQPWRGLQPATKGRHWFVPVPELDELDRKGLIIWPQRGDWPRLKVYLSDDEGIPVQSIWSDIFPVNSQAGQRLGYPTQKPVALIERVLAASCPPGGLVLDCFAGSGTTLEAAERLGRRWIGIDCGKYAIHLARKRLILLHDQPKPPAKLAYDYEECKHCKNIERKARKQKSPGPFRVQPFTLENVGVYQRAEQWQDFQRQRSMYRDEMVKVFGGEPADVSPLLHGRKGRSWVHVGPLDGPVSSAQVWSIAQEAARTDLHSVTVLSADFDTVSASDRAPIKEATGVTLDVRIIPKNAIDEVKRRIEAQRHGENVVIESMAVPAFYAPLSIILGARADGKQVKVTLERCEVDHESFLQSQTPTLKPVEGAGTATQKRRAQEEDKRWRARKEALLAWLDKARSWQHFVDFWAIDWNYGERLGEDGKPIFETDWQSFRTPDRKGTTSGLTFSAEFRYEKPGLYRVAARVTDVFGNDGIATAQVTVK